MQLAADKPPLKRGLRTGLQTALEDTPVVCVLGARQCGKSTLVAQFAPERTYITLDDAAYLNAAQIDPQGFITSLPDFVTIDEIQRAPALTLAIKCSVDADRRPGRFLLTGSANLLQLPRLADSLAGRMEVLNLHTFSESEKSAMPGLFLHNWLNGELRPSFHVREQTPPSELITRMVAGGYPEACQRAPIRATRWLQQYLNAIIERDIHDVAQVVDATHIARLMTMIAHRNATLLNISNLANALKITRPTIERHLSILEKLFLVRRLPAWHGNPGKRLVKTPKLHICDSGLAATLAGLQAKNWIPQRPRFGHLLESFIVQQLITQAGWTTPELQFWHYRDKDKVEVDCVITLADQVWGVEIKLAQAVSPSDTRGLQRLAALAGEHFQGGIVFYDGSDILPMGDAHGKDLLAVPIAMLWEM